MTRFVVLAAVLVSILAAPASRADVATGDPAYSVGADQLAASLECSSDGLREHVDKEPVLLVHGTFTKGHEQYAWNWELKLQELGFDYCVVTMPYRGMGDMQISAEYIAYAVETMYSRAGRQIGMVGHSQGASMPRWAIKYWPGVRAALADFVPIAGPAHGTTVAGAPNPLASAIGGEPAAFYQFSPESHFTDYVNRSDETPGSIDYTSIYSYTDELVQPGYAVGDTGPTAALDWGHADPAHVVNINVQDVCPGRVVDHVSIGTTDPFVMALAVDALTHDGPASLDRVGTQLCSAPDAYVTAGTLPGMQQACCGPTPQDFSSVPRYDEEPPIRQYAIDQDGT